MAYAPCATGEAKAISTGAYEVKVAKDQLNMALVKKIQPPNKL